MQIEKLRGEIDTIAGLCAQGKTEISDSECIAPSFLILRSSSGKSPSKLRSDLLKKREVLICRRKRRMIYGERFT